MVESMCAPIALSRLLPAHKKTSVSWAGYHWPECQTRDRGCDDACHYCPWKAVVRACIGWMPLLTADHMHIICQVMRIASVPCTHHIEGA